MRLFGEDVQVNAEIRQLTGLSGHADRTGLETWIASFSPRPAFVFVNHGEDEVAERWAEHLRDEGYTAAAPYNGAIYQLTGGHAACLEPGVRERIRKPAPQDRDVVRTSPAFERLVNMGKRLLVVIEHNRGGANKDLAKFASQIQALCDKWDR